VGPDVEEWFARKTAKEPDWLAAWATHNPAVVANWAKSDDAIKAYVLQWADKHPEITADWRKDHPEPGDKPNAEDLAVPFFASYAKAHPGTWPTVVEETTAGGKKEKKVQPARKGTDVQAALFDAWLQENPDADLEKVPADMVMASGSGLDPHITRRSADYQLDRVAAAWARKTGAAEGTVREEVRKLLNENQEAPLGGLVGVPLINVLEVNLLLPERMKGLATAGR
jgi:K+-transporting ATPase ATPase C chain